MDSNLPAWDDSGEFPPAHWFAIGRNDAQEWLKWGRTAAEIDAKLNDIKAMLPDMIKASGAKTAPWFRGIRAQMEHAKWELVLADGEKETK